MDNAGASGPPCLTIVTPSSHRRSRDHRRGNLEVSLAETEGDIPPIVGGGPGAPSKWILDDVKVMAPHPSLLLGSGQQVLVQVVSRAVNPAEYGSALHRTARQPSP
ncbi:hypothetical protein MKZ38_003521 [Zalerion maritima]|uniref:Uncharacterized protein n=1 Tax=Zalerion maritima TaxID=339359 RepID=A0AAD5WQ76_9PEZI|nr:hypothetical protein MKZ38_003521 [Zalerion maritima]